VNEIILLGAGGHAHSCIDVIELSNQYQIAGLVAELDSNKERNLRYPILGNDDDLLNLRKIFNYALVAVGQIKSPSVRIRLFQRLQELDYKLPVIISPRSYVSKNAQIEEGTIILHDVMVNTNVKVGKNCIINNKALIEHDAVIGNHCHISTGAIINGEVTVGNGSFIGSGTVTKQSVSVGKDCVVGAGVVIKKDIEANVIIKK